MTFFELILNILRQFQLIAPDKLKDLSFEADKWEETATPINSDDKFKQLYGKLHQGEYGLLVRMVVMPILYFYLRIELKNMEKGTEEELL